MKQVFILLVLVLKNCDGNKIVKRFANEQNHTTDDSFQVNVSAGYGVDSENASFTSPSPVYKFQERRIEKENITASNHQDQVSQPSQTVQEILPSPTYQVHEKSPELQEKHFQVAKNHRYRSLEKRVRHKNNEIKKIVNDLEQKESARHQPARLPAGTKIVEVLRVPAMYELHLQSDPQRLVSLNSAWLKKLNGLMNENQHKKQYQSSGTKNFPQQSQSFAASHNAPFLQHPQGSGLSFAQLAASNKGPQILDLGFTQPAAHNKVQSFQQPQSLDLGFSQSVHSYQQPHSGFSQSSTNNKVPSYQKPQSLNLNFGPSTASKKVPSHQQPQNPGWNYPQPSASNNIPLFQQPQSSSFPQAAATNNVLPQRLGGIFQNLKLKLFNAKPKILNQQIGNSYGLNQQKLTPQVQSFGGFKNNYLLPQSHQNFHDVSTDTITKAQESSTQSPVSYQLLSNEISADSYQKPQALHEVPAPVLNKDSYKQSLPKITATSVPSLVYGKPVDPPYQPLTQGNVQEQNGLLPSFQYSKGQVDSLSSYYQQTEKPTVDSISSYYQQTEKPQELYYQQQQSEKPNDNTHGQFQTQHLINSQNYQGYKNVQNYYNDAIGDYLDQNLANVNGGVSSYINSDGTMTVSNFHHNPELYQPPMQYEVPVNENTSLEEANQDFNVMSYNNDATNFNNYMYPGFAADVAVPEHSQIQTGENQAVDMHNHVDLSNVHSSVEVPAQRNERMSGYGRNYIGKRMYPRAFSISNRRMEPMDYILYIKERTVD